MFDVGFTELLLVFIVGLLILGPERLPHAAKTAGLWIRRIRRSIDSIQRDINMQLDQEELEKKLLDNNQRVIKETNTETTATNQTPAEEAPISPSSSDTENTSPSNKINQ